MASQVTLKALGLNYSPNQLSLDQGSLLVANDVIIRRDNTLESRRGMREYSEGLGLSTDRIKQLIEYKGRILAHYTNKLAFDTLVTNPAGKYIFDDFAGSYLETQDGLRIKSIEANKNLYFTTLDGIKKISAKTAADFTTAAGFIKSAGAVQALDFTALLDVTQGQTSGFLPPDTAVAYRVVWGYRDRNDNLILGVPSDRVIVYNYLTDLMGMDLDALLVVLDTINQSTSLITDGDYASSFYSGINPSGDSLLNNILQLAIKLDNDILYADQGGTAPLDMSTIEILDNEIIITFDAGMTPEDYFTVADKIELKDFGATFSVVNGFQTITFVDNTTRTIKMNITNANIGSAAVDPAATIYSYNYRNITATGDINFPDPLDTLTLSIPPTSEQLRIIKNNLFRISERLKVELSGVIPTALQTAYITPYILTEAANVKLNITIPSNIDSDYFVQVYRTRNFTADGVQTLGDNGGVPVIPDDEMRQVYEAFPTAAEILAGQLSFIDTAPEALIENNTNLYTNPVTGDGILQANFQPPFAKDINTFKNYTFYSNTRTKYQIPIIQLLGVSNIVSGDKITISSSLGSITYTFVTGVQEETDITFNMAGLAAGEYFILYSAQDSVKVYFWYEIDGVGSAPVVSDGITVKIPILSTFTNNELAERSRDVINTLIYDFTAAETTLPTIRVTNIDEGKATNGSAGTSPFTVTVFQQGNGEDAATQQVLLSSLVSAAQAIDETARSFVRIINKQPTSIVNAYYISGDSTPPGQINLQSKNLNDPAFYVIASADGIGLSFNPDISPVHTDITSISVANPTVITTSSPHGLRNEDTIIITNSNSTPSIDGFHSVTVLSSTTFSVPVNVTIAGNQGVWTKTTDIEYAVNEVKPNRIYYSKINQPEAVPLLNYLDVSAEDKEILRIFPLRDTLFIMKQDGLYRISGVVAPFVLSLFDTSCVLVAPDSVDIANNIIYGWTTKGISNIVETGVSEISRPIDIQILKISSSNYTNFSKLTWGVGYDSDNSYTVYTNTDTDDENATVAFRFCNLTNTWTNFVRTQTCGIVLDTDDKLYEGSGDRNLIEQERKDFSRTDYADRDFEISLSASSTFNNGKTLQFTSIDNIEVGDVVLQEQYLNLYLFNKLLKHLDSDPTVGYKNYFSTLQAVTGDNLRSKIVSLAQKLDTDSGLVFSDYFDRIDTKSGVISSNSVAFPTIISTTAPHELIPGRIVLLAGTQTPNSIPQISGANYTVSNTGTFGSSSTFTIPIDVNTAGGTGLNFTTGPNLNDFLDIKACFNEIVNRLNNDSGATFNSYVGVTEITPYEAVILSIDKNNKKITVDLPLQWIIGPMTIFKSIPCEVGYAPETMGDSLSDKQISEATIMLESRAVNNFMVSFASDLIPEYFPVTFFGSGNGLFGSSSIGFGYGFFGGIGNGAPFRTIIPRKIQRCRYIVIRLNHNVARENFVVFGITLSGNVGISTRAYR